MCRIPVCETVCVWATQRKRNKGREKKRQRKLLIILASIRRNTSSRYPWRRVMNASYCSLADIRRSSPPPPHPSLPVTCTFPLLLGPLLPSLSPSSLSFIPAVTCTSFLIPSLIFLVFFFHAFLQHRMSSISTFSLSFLISAVLTTSPISLSPVLFSYPFHLLLSHDRHPTSSHPAPPSVSILHLLNLWCLSSSSPTQTQLTHPCWTVKLFFVCVSLGDHLETRSPPQPGSRLGFYPLLCCNDYNPPTAC